MKSKHFFPYEEIETKKMTFWAILPILIGMSETVIDVQEHLSLQTQESIQSLPHKKFQFGTLVHQKT